MKKQNMKNLEPQTAKPQKVGLLEPQETQPAQWLSMTSDLVFRTVLGRDTPECKRALIAVLNLILDRQNDPEVHFHMPTTKDGLYLLFTTTEKWGTIKRS